MESERPVGARRALALINKQTSKSLLVSGLWDVLIKDIPVTIKQLVKYFTAQTQTTSPFTSNVFITQPLFTEHYSHYVVYWPEGSVSSINASKVQPDKVAVGQECQLTIGKNKKHNGIVVARGKENIHKCYTILYFNVYFRHTN